MANPNTVVIAGKEYLTYPHGYAAALDIAPRTARRWRTALSTPPIIQVGRQQLIDPDDIGPWLESLKAAPLRPPEDGDLPDFPSECQFFPCRCAELTGVNRDYCLTIEAQQAEIEAKQVEIEEKRAEIAKLHAEIARLRAQLEEARR